MKTAFEFDGAGGGVNLVVQGLQSTRGQFFGLRAVEGIHRQSMSGVQLFEDLRQIIFRHVENDGDGLKLVMTAASAVVLLACAMLPSSTNRNPTRPEMGEVIWQ